MEILIVVAIMTIVVKRGVEDVIHTAKGGTPPRYAAASARRKSGAAGRYWGQLWDDVWEDASRRHAERRERASSPSRPRGAATVYLSNLWRDGWVRAERRRQEKATRPRPGQQTVPGTVVPNAQDEDRPQDGDGPEPRIVPTEDGRTDLRFGEDEDDPTGVRSCPECGGTVLVDGEICPSCRDRQKQRSQHWDEQDEPDSVPDYPPDFGPDQDIDPSPATPPTEGPTMTTVTGEVTGLEAALQFADQAEQQYRAQVTSCEAVGARSTQNAKAYREQVVNIEAARGAIVAAGVTGVAVDRFTNAMDVSNSAAEDMEAAAKLYASAQEKSGVAAADMEASAAEFRSHLGIKDQFSAHPGAGSKEFIMAD